MATGSEFLEGDEGSNIDLTAFLQSAKIKNIDEISGILEKRNVSIEELMDCDSTDLDIFLQNDLKLDILSRKRFMKKLDAFKPKQIAPVNVTQRPKVIISMKEQKALELMHEHYDKSSQLQQTIMNGLSNLDQQMIECIDSMNEQFENILVSLIEERKAVLITDVDTMKENKFKLLKSECESLEKYQIELNDAKEKRQKMISSQTGNGIKQSRMRLDILNEAIYSDNAHSHFVTAPLIDFKSLKNAKIISSFLNTLEIHTFEIPTKPYALMDRLGFKFCSILFFVNNELKSNDDPRKILQYEVSWCSAPDRNELNDVAIVDDTDNFDMFNEKIVIDDAKKTKKSKRKKHKKKKKKSKKKKKKKDKNMTNYGQYNGESDNSSSMRASFGAPFDSHSDTDSDAFDNESMSDSDLSDSTDSDEDEEKETKSSIAIKKIKNVSFVQITDSSQFKWKSMMVDANDDNQKYYFHFLQNLKPNRSYFARVRAQNKYGWSDYSKALHFKTPKLKKEKEIKLDLVKCRGWYSSTSYQASNILVDNGNIYASPIESDSWGSPKKDPDWLIFRPQNKKKKYYLTRLVIKARNDGQSPKTISLQIGDEKLSALQECKNPQYNLLQSKLSKKKMSKLKKSVNYDWVKCKPSKLTMIRSTTEQSFDINPKIMPEIDTRFNYYKLLFWDNQGGSGPSCCKYVCMNFKLFGVEIK